MLLPDWFKPQVDAGSILTLVSWLYFTFITVRRRYKKWVQSFNDHVEARHQENVQRFEAIGTILNGQDTRLREIENRLTVHCDDEMERLKHLDTCTDSLKNRVHELTAKFDAYIKNGFHKASKRKAKRR